MNHIIMNKEKLSHIKTVRFNDGFDAGKEYWEEQFQNRIDNLNKENKRVKKERAQAEENYAELEEDTNRKIEGLETKIDVLESERDDVRGVVNLEVHLKDLESSLDQRKSDLDERTAKLKTRESNIDSKEETNYKKGYADGVADGVRKVSEITAKDRENAMKIAMVAASSHTPVQNLKELNNVHSLTAGTTDSED